MNTHHRPDSIHRAVESANAKNVAIAFSHEDQILGTAGAIAKAREDGRLDLDLPLLVINAKLYTDLDLEDAMRFHVHQKAKVTMVLRPNLEKEHFREVLVEKDRVVGFGEGRVPKGASPLLFTGIHILDPEVVRAIPLRASDTVADIYPPLIQRREVAAHVDPRGRWWEFSTLERYLDLHVRAHDEGLGPDVSMSEGAAIHPTAGVHRAVLWESARVDARARVERTVLSMGAHVPEGAEVENAVIARRDRVETQGPFEPFGPDQILVPLARPRLDTSRP